MSSNPTGIPWAPSASRMEKFKEHVPLRSIEEAMKVTPSCKAQPIGGWDVAKRMPKPVRYAIPQGSVYFIEFSGEMSKAWIKIGKLSILGFGLGFVGVWGDGDV